MAGFPCVGLQAVYGLTTIATLFICAPCLVLAQDTRITLDLVGESPLPFQPVRVRVTIINASGQTVGPIAPLEYFNTFRVKPPGSDSFADKPTCEFLRESTSASVPSASMFANKITLKPGQQISMLMSFAFMASSQSARTPLVDRCEPCFPLPGMYELQFGYRLAHGAKSGSYLHSTLKVMVNKQSDFESELVDRLKNDRPLLLSLMKPNDRPEDSQLMKLRGIADNYAKSTYALYARYALGLHALKAESLTDESRARIIEDVKSIASTDFAYHVRALLLLRELDYLSAERYERVVLNHYCDSVEFLSGLAGFVVKPRIKTLDDYLLWRLRKPTPFAESKAP